MNHNGDDGETGSMSAKEEPGMRVAVAGRTRTRWDGMWSRN